MTNYPRPMGVVPVPHRPPMPEDIRTARQLWWAIIGFGVVQLVGTVLTSLQRRADLDQRMFDQGKAGDPNFAMATAELLVSLMLVAMVLAGLALAAGAFAVVHQFGRGKLWARTVLAVLAVWLVLGAVAALFALDAVTGVASLVAGGAAIVQGVLAGGALFLSFRPDSTTYFQNSLR
ncbi:hypothetical protein [Nocardia xishanensis]|uniref:hypothetical protein n=1 Tax=Nocardia xishanensis TaxID=238964 RepID=UPI0008326DF3|nr:hypothetical protein [Nocardia xishanensis]